MRDHPRLHLGVLIEEVVQAVGERVHQFSQPGRTRPVLRAQRVGIDEQLHPQILIHRGLPFRLGKPAQCIQVIRLDAIEVIFGLSVLHAEDGVRIGLTIDMGDAPVVADDRDFLGATLPAGEIAAPLGRRGSGKAERTTDE